MNTSINFNEYGNKIQKLYIPNMLLLPKSLTTARREWEYESK